MSELNTGVPFLDLSSEFAELRDEWFDSIAESGRRGQFILGEHVAGFEREVASYVGTRHAVGVANGTDALILALRALGVGPSDEVITSPFTFFASAESISLVGARPVFADIDPQTFNVAPERVRERVTDATRAFMPVHLYGQAADLESHLALSEKHGIAIVEDAAQAFGARWRNKCVGGVGCLGCFSFYPTKVLGGYGDGGLITTDDDDLAATLRRLRNHGSEQTFIHTDIGYNSRLDEIQAALLRIKLRGVDRAIDGRRRVAARYDELLSGTSLIVPGRHPDSVHAYNVYTVRSPHRDRLRDHLRSRNIGCSVYYPEPLHLQPVYRDLGYRAGDFPEAERAAQEVLALPIFPQMSDAQIQTVCTALREGLGE